MTFNTNEGITKFQSTCWDNEPLTRSCIIFRFAYVSIGNARFMKTIRGRHSDGLVVVKIFVKPEPQMSLRHHIRKLQGSLENILCKRENIQRLTRCLSEEYDALLDVSNAFSCQHILETEKAAYLVRQYFYSSLYDRIRLRLYLPLYTRIANSYSF